MTEEELIAARDRLLTFAHQQFASNPDVVAVFLAGSLAAGVADAYSDIDLRVVVKPEKHGWFVEHRCEIPTSWPDFLFNEWRPGTVHCVSHFRFFVKIDIFYFSQDGLQPSPWYTLPVRVLHDPHGVVEQLLKRSAALRFEITEEDLDFSISKGLAAAHESFRRMQRQELVFAQILLDELRFHIIQADDWLFDRTPRTQVCSKFDQRGSREVIESLRASFCGCDKAAFRVSIATLSRLYRQQIIQLHARFHPSRHLESDLAALDLILSDLSEGAGHLARNR
jgi:hypothetical protein